MTIEQTLKKATATIKSTSTSSSPALDAEVLLSFVLKTTREKILAHPEETVGPRAQKRFEKLINKRVAGFPVAYLTGVKEFYGFEFLVTPSVLIPRPETEMILEFAIKKIKSIRRAPGNAPLQIADVGTGSGAAAIVFAKNFPESKIYASDISKRALKIATKNLKRHKISNVTLIQSDLLKNYPRVKFDFIFANLPYLSPEVYAKTSKDVKNEPKKALLGGKGGLCFYQKLIASLEPFVNNNKSVLRYAPTSIFLEIDAHQFLALKKILKKQFPKRVIEPIYNLEQKNILGLYAVLKNN